MLNRPYVRPLLAALTALLATIGVTIVVSSDGPDGPTVVTITVNSDAGKTTTVTAPKPVVEQAADRLHAGLRTEQPAGVTPGQLDAAREQQERLAETDQLPIVTPLAAPVQAGCRSRFVANASSRRGTRPRLFVLHYTVSGNRPGWDDVNAITALFDRPAFAASSTYVLDREAHCAYIVRESDKPWTQATFNPVSISVEIINSGRERNLIDGPGRRQLIRIMAGSLRRWHIPAQQAVVRGCTVIRPGIIDHAALGACGGGHSDVNPYRAEIPGLIAAVKAATVRRRVTPVDRVTCRKLRWWRANGRPHGLPERRAVRRRAALERRGVTCTAASPVLR